MNAADGMVLDWMHPWCLFSARPRRPALRPMRGGMPRCGGLPRARARYFGSALKTAPHLRELPVCPRIFFASHGRAMEVT